jgi:hypothetical protein
VGVPAVFLAEHSLAAAFLAEARKNPEFLAELQGCKTELSTRAKP